MLPYFFIFVFNSYINSLSTTILRVFIFKIILYFRKRSKLCNWHDGHHETLLFLYSTVAYINKIHLKNVVFSIIILVYK